MSAYDQSIKILICRNGKEIVLRVFCKLCDIGKIKFLNCHNFSLIEGEAKFDAVVHQIA